MSKSNVTIAASALFSKVDDRLTATTFRVGGLKQFYIATESSTKYAILTRVRNLGQREGWGVEFVGGKKAPLAGVSRKDALAAASAWVL